MSVYAPRISAALAASIDTGKLAEAWLALHPGLTKATGIPPAITTGITDAVTAALKAVLGDLWPEGWVLGEKSAEAASAGVADVDWGAWKPGDAAAAREIAGPGLRQLLGEAGIRIKSIAESRLEELSQVLEDTLRSNEITREPTGPLPPFLSVGDLASRLRGVLDNPANAELVAQAEIARAQATAARTVYAETGRTEVEVSTAEDDKVCPICDAAEKLGAHPLGAPPLVPLHPRCRCAELPVLETSGPHAAPQPAAPAAAPAAPAQAAEKPPASPARILRQRVVTSGGLLQPSLDAGERKELKAQTAAAGKAMTPAQRKVIDQWTSTNGMVRRIQTGKTSEKTATAFNDAMQSAPKVDGLVYRGVKTDSRLADLVRQLKPGQELELGEPVSTSIDPKQSAGFGTILFEIDSPAASFIAGIGKLYEYEQEAVLAPGRFRVISIEGGTVSVGSNMKAPVKIVKLEDVTQGGRSWLPTSGADLAAAKAAEEDDDRSERFMQGDGPGEFKLVEDS